MHSIGVWWLWLVFFIIISIVLTIDLFLFGGRKQHQVSLKSSFIWSGVWIGLSLLFNAFLWLYLAQSHTISFANKKALEFFTAYLIEKSLSMDNIFIFVMIFHYFSIPLNFQRRLLLYGVLGAITSRLLLILAGIWLINHFDWIFYLFGLLLIYSSIRIFSFQDGERSMSDNLILRGLRQVLPLTDSISDQQFWVKEKGRYYFTPLFVVLVFIEISDLMFAVDSIPAVFGVTNDPFIAFTSNAFAILGLRAMYFILANIQNQFYFLKYGLAFILCFIGMKMLLHDVVEIPVLVTLAVVMFSLFASITLSKLLNIDTKKN
ncbi:TerC/Alx family metal homeostasis membrane protein [Legionella nagasakiensis]|uniref:TerC/Alx family metal homeostasis membrane protein n=1 Tax=Legionella nagasakiensis TaxID=535290 RepID=UPI001054162B|nr:TerC/Alx family metal homeostasis membrane protein [Legionella nagasakiensis]